MEQKGHHDESNKGHPSCHSGYLVCVCVWQKLLVFTSICVTELGISQIPASKWSILTNSCQCNVNRRERIGVIVSCVVISFLHK